MSQDTTEYTPVEYKLAEKVVLKELPSKYPVTFECLVITKAFLTALVSAIMGLFACFKTETDKEYMYITLVMVWIIATFINFIVMWSASYYDVIHKGLWIAGVIYFGCFVTHMLMGHMKCND